MSQEKEKFNSRRDFINKSGLAILGTAALNNGVLNSNVANASEIPEEWPAFWNEEVIPLDGSNEGNLVVEKGGRKPVYLAKQDSKDVIVHSLAENIFWIDLMMEHAMFFALLMPGIPLTRTRLQSVQYYKQFKAYLDILHRVKWSDRTYKEYNLKSIELVRSIIDFSKRMYDQQSSGKLQSLVWPTFFEHTIHESERFVSRLELLNRGVVVFERSEVVGFWAHIMSEHSEFIAHFLDPKEKELIKKANQFAEQFEQLRTGPGEINALAAAGQEIIDFKTAAEKGIDTGKIKSMINPTLADHVRREAVKYVDELKRSQANQD